MIVKVQLSIRTTEPEQQILIYDRARSFRIQASAGAMPEVVRAMGGSIRSFFEASNDGGAFVLGAPVPEQGW